MALDRISTLRLTGLITEPNEYGVYPPGACRVARNVLFRAPNKCTSARGINASHVFGQPGGVIKKIVPLKDGHVLSIEADGSEYNVYADGIEVTQPPAVAAAFQPAYATSFHAHGRAFLNSNQGVLVLDTLTPQTAPERTLRCAGLVQPTLNQLGFVTGAAAAAIPATTAAAWCVVFRRERGDYILVSVPSVAYRLYNSGGAAVDVQLIVRWLTDSDVRAGDIVEVYRSQGLGSDGDPGVDFRMVTSYTLTLADIGASQVSLYDRQPMDATLRQTTGKPLYSAVGQEGATGTNRLPPACKAMCTWGAYSFYGNITERPQFTLSIPGGFGSTADSYFNTTAFRTYGVGQRIVTGDLTNGSNTVTNVNNTTGIVVGQIFNGGTAGLPSGTATVTAVTATTITFSHPATTTAAGQSLTLMDILEINGQKVWMLGVSGFLQQLGYLLGYEVTTNQTVPILGTVIKDFVAVLEPSRYSVSSISVRATNGANYAPPLPEISSSPKIIQGATYPNLVRWSKDNQPEHCPTGNETLVGQSDLVAMLQTRDAVWAFCTDGIYLLSGIGGVWNVYTVVLGCVPISPGAVARLLDRVYAWTNRGLVEVTPSGVREISQSIIDPANLEIDALDFEGTAFRATDRIKLVADEKNRELHLLLVGEEVGDTSKLLVYNTVYNAFSTLAFADQRITAFEYQSMAEPNVDTGFPGDGRPLMATAPGGASQPQLHTWDQRTGAPLEPVVLLQPLYATGGGDSDPVIQKRWVDTTWICDKANTALVTATYNSITPYAADALKPNQHDSQVSFGIDPDFVRGQAISPGLRCSTLTSDTLTILGVSMRYRNVTTESKT